ncbi:hypothetical protein [Ignicoccus hospitalis]|uniref:Uncharacterized protein n=1 Tax=Ignicoccus hospitalis (strain KIN4/I / DSM 18386 / JCM 14125) TaxID=453591 RepID=A8AAM0_IGNH4|nr:hypothetical protein [Ignicoccus hospitalis]ABU81972.1 hypothetical protein Igni_0790 [Ignicoccus hospitalis KIN4/I]HIH89869.1 hypothetical protein [Desulfurococcaceae archaeon]
MDGEQCPFARKLNKLMYLCLVDGRAYPDFLGLHTKRWKECSLFREGLAQLDAIQKCLVRAGKLGVEVLEYVIKRLEEGASIPKKCPKESACAACPCNYEGKCLLGIK